MFYDKFTRHDNLFGRWQPLPQRSAKSHPLRRQETHYHPFLFWGPSILFMHSGESSFVDVVVIGVIVVVDVVVDRRAASV